MIHLILSYRIFQIKKTIRICCLLFLFVGSCTNGFSQDNDPNLGIIPAPVSVEKMTGKFIFSTQTRIISDNPHNKAFVYLENFLKHNWFNALPDYKKSKGKLPFSNTIILTSAGISGLPDEGYRIKITPGKIIISGKSAGLFYGVQTFIQLLPLKKDAFVKIPCAQIEDYPRFAYRGFMLDVSRHFFSEEYVKRVIDRMAACKLNRFHWHLTDSEGWRIEIKKYPKLTNIAAYRTNPVTGGNRAGVGGNRDGLDSISRGGYYTQDQIRNIVKYAADRYITIIPEIEMPGHSRAALRAYPELMCQSIASSESEYNDNTYCPTEATFQFLEGVLSEVVALFPGKYIHIGGDEVNKIPWKQSDFCQELIKQLNLKDEEGLQSYFMKRIEQYVNSKGKRIIGWDEILEGGLAPNATVMSWRGEQGGIAAAKQKHYVVMTPGNAGMYFDNAQSLSSDEPISIGFYAPLGKTYNYNPVPASLNDNEKKYILGVQANLWTEFISTPAKVEYMMFPRLFALAEVGWTPPEKKNYKDFLTVRLPEHLAKLDQEGINFRVPVPFGITDTTLIGHQFTIKLKPPLPGAKIYYTLNGRKPGDTDPTSQDALKFLVPAGQTRELQAIAVSPLGRRSVPVKVVIKNIVPLATVKVDSVAPELRYHLFRDELSGGSSLVHPEFADLGLIPSINTTWFKNANPLIGFSLTGYLKIDKEDTYTFYLQSVNNAQLFIDDEIVLNNCAGTMQKESLPLARGLHKIRVNYFNSTNTMGLKVLMAEPGTIPKEIAADMLFH